MPAEILRTARLSLRRASPLDFEILHARIFSDPDVMRFVFRGGALSAEDAIAFFHLHFDFGDKRGGLGALIERVSGETIGFAGLLKCSALAADDYEFGFVLARQFWGKGYGTEIGRGQIDYGFGVLECHRLLALVSTANTASIATIRKLGMRYHSGLHSAERGERLVYVIDSQ